MADRRARGQGLLLVFLAMLLWAWPTEQTTLVVWCALLFSAAFPVSTWLASTVPRPTRFVIAIVTTGLAALAITHRLHVDAQVNDGLSPRLLAGIAWGMILVLAPWTAALRRRHPGATTEPDSEEAGASTSEHP